MISSPFPSTLLAMSEAGVAALVRTGAAAVARAGGLVWIEAGRAVSGATNEKISARISNSRFTLTPYLFGDELERFNFLHESLRICTTNLSQRSHRHRRQPVALFLRIRMSLGFCLQRPV